MCVMTIGYNQYNHALTVIGIKIIFHIPIWCRGSIRIWDLWPGVQTTIGYVLSWRCVTSIELHPHKWTSGEIGRNSEKGRKIYHHWRFFAHYSAVEQYQRYGKLRSFRGMSQIVWSKWWWWNYETWFGKYTL